MSSRQEEAGAVLQGPGSTEEAEGLRLARNLCVHGVRCVWVCVHVCMLFFFLPRGQLNFEAFFYKKQAFSPPSRTGP